MTEGYCTEPSKLTNTLLLEFIENVTEVITNGLEVRKVVTATATNNHSNVNVKTQVVNVNCSNKG